MTPELAAPPGVRPHEPPARKRTGWPAFASVLLHLALLLLIVVAAQRVRHLPEAVPAAPVEMIFEGGSKTPPSVPNPAPVAPTQPASPAPQPTQPAEVPVPPAPPPPVPAPPPTSAPTPAPPEPAPSPPAPAVEAPVAPRPPPPMPQPVPPMPRKPMPEAAVPLPKALPTPPHAVARPAPPRNASPAFPAPMDFSLGPRSEDSAARPMPPHEAKRPGTIDLSFAPTAGGSNTLQMHAEADGKDVGADWLNRVAAWWGKHGYYPTQAAQLDQEGNVVVQMTVAHDGHVQSLDLTQASGSPWLDLGALSVFRNAMLPPLPPDVTTADTDLSFTIHYVILR